jgi:hypothetical protein
MANAPAAPSRPSGDTMHSGKDGERSSAAPPKPRTDTIALVEKNAAQRTREVPTWLAIVAIVALSLVAGMTTYLVRLRASAPSDAPAATTTASNAKP